MTDEEIIKTFKYCTYNRTPEACVDCLLFTTCRANPTLLENLVIGVLDRQTLRINQFLKEMEGKHDK
jgi:hypothetical protein